MKDKFGKYSLSDDELKRAEEFAIKLFKIPNIDIPKVYKKAYFELRKEFKISPRKINLIRNYRKIYDTDEVPDIIKADKAAVRSGICSIGILMKPGKFSCPYDCFYCPNVPGIARSYLPEEPTVKRGKRNEWDACKMVRDKLSALYIKGHVLDKLEIIIKGGTFTYYPKKYAEEFVRDIFYTCNTFKTYKGEILLPERFERYNLQEEKKFNTVAQIKIIGITIETRPDEINKSEIRRYRYLGITRVEMGVQHTDDSILKIVNRKCKTSDSIRAIKLLKDNCFKVDIHLMPALPGSSLRKDKKMFKDVLENPNLQVDQWKIYPTEITSNTKIKDWYEKGMYEPYYERDENALVELQKYLAVRMHRYIRINRITRGFQDTNIVSIGKVKNTIRQIANDELKKEGQKCKCIRCQEVGLKDVDYSKARKTVIKYESSKGTEYFIHYASCPHERCWKYYWYLVCYYFLILFGIRILWYGCGKENNLFGFLRLRLLNNYDDVYFPELRKKTALVRELHVYGQVVGTYEKTKKDKTQHRGFGSKLLKEAERIAKYNKYKTIAIISGVGVRNYYQYKHGYKMAPGPGEFMMKRLLKK